jgi:cytochrome c553
MRPWLPLVAGALVLAAPVLAQQGGEGGVGRQNAPDAPADPGRAAPRPAFAPAGRVAIPPPTPAAAEAGRLLVSTGGAGAPREHACMWCHRRDGEGDPSGVFPRLDGQPAWYLFKQLRDYASGERENPVMSPIASAMTQREMLQAAAHYAALPAGPARGIAAADLRTLELGAALASRGAPEEGIAACASCHGADGEGVPPSFPRLAGQYGGYAARQLRAWREGQRANDPLGVMAAIASGMTDAQIRAVAAHYERLGGE